MQICMLGYVCIYVYLRLRLHVSICVRSYECMNVRRYVFIWGHQYGMVEPNSTKVTHGRLQENRILLACYMFICGYMFFVVI